MSGQEEAARSLICQPRTAGAACKSPQHTCSGTDAVNSFARLAVIAAAGHLMVSRHDKAPPPLGPAGTVCLKMGLHQVQQSSAGMLQLQLELQDWSKTAAAQPAQGQSRDA